MNNYTPALIGSIQPPSVECPQSIDIIVDEFHHQAIQNNQELYIIIDAAANEQIYPKLIEGKYTHSCLFDGPKTPIELQSAAPHLLKVKRARDFVSWCCKQGIHKHWLIFFVAPNKPLREIAIHLKRIAFVSHRGKRMYFRYHDPRVLGSFLPTCTEEDREFIFRDIESFILPEISHLTGKFRLNKYLKSGAVEHLSLDTPTHYTTVTSQS